MIRILVGLKHQWEDVCQIGTSRLLVHRALVEVGGLALILVSGKHMHHWYWCVEDLGRGFDEAGVTTVPAGSVKEEPIDVHTWNVM